MTKAQWVFEYVALLEKEKEERTFHIKALRNVIISTFGLDIPNKARGDEDPESFTPLVMLAGNHHMLKAILDEVGKEKDRDPTKGSNISDKEYEEQLKRMDIGMEPLENDPFADIPMKELLQRRDTQLLGIQIREENDGLLPPSDDMEPIVMEPPKGKPQLPKGVFPIDSFDLSLLNEEGTPHSRPKTRQPLVRDENG